MAQVSVMSSLELLNWQVAHLIVTCLLLWFTLNKLSFVPLCVVTANLQNVCTYKYAGFANTSRTLHCCFVTYISGHKMSSLVYALNFSLQLWILGSTGSQDGESNVPPIGWEDVRQIY